MSPNHSYILCATDLKASGARALDLASSVAHTLDESVVLVHVTDVGEQATPDAAQVVAEAERTLRERVHARAMNARAELERESARANDIVSRTCLIEGRPAEAIVRHADSINARAIVLGPHVRSSAVSEATARIVGTTAARVLRTAPCPVFVATGSGALPALRDGIVVVGIDLDESARAVLVRASEFAERAKAKLHVVHVRGSSAASADADLAALVSEIQARSPDLTLRGSVRHGEPARELCAVASTEGASLIAVGTHGRKGLQRAMLGSVAEATLAVAEVPVLVIPPTT